METLLTILRETEELFRVANKCPSSELTLLLWKMTKASQYESYYSQIDEKTSINYGFMFETDYNRLADLGYVPLDF